MPVEWVALIAVDNPWIVREVGCGDRLAEDELWQPRREHPSEADLYQKTRSNAQGWSFGDSVHHEALSATCLDPTSDRRHEPYTISPDSHARTGLTPAHICTGTGLAPAHICAWTGLSIHVRVRMGKPYHPRLGNGWVNAEQRCADRYGLERPIVRLPSRLNRDRPSHRMAEQEDIGDGWMALLCELGKLTGKTQRKTKEDSAPRVASREVHS